MDYPKLKFFFCLAVCLAMLLAPFALDITPDGKAQALTSKSGNQDNFVKDKKIAKKGKTSWSEYKPLDEKNTDGPSAPQPVPEPATMLLVGGGLVGLAAFKRKFKK